MSTLKQIGVGLCVVVVVCAGMLWVTLGPEVKAEANRAAGAVRRAATGTTLIRAVGD